MLSLRYAHIVVIVLALSTLIQQDANQLTKVDSDNILAEKMAPHDHFDMMISYPDMIPDYRGMDQALHAAHMQVNSGIRTNGFDEEWVFEGPGNIGARINSIAVPSGQSDTIYIGYGRGGIYRTYDGGTNWSSIFDGQERLCIGSIAVNPKNSAVIYAGTGDKNIGGRFSTGVGAFKSYDHGDTWENIGLTDQKIISKIAINPIDTAIVYAATMGNPSLPGTDRGLYKSSDGGSTWSKILHVGDSAGVNDIVVNPINPDEIYVTGWNRYRTNQVSIINGNAGKIWKSTNGGSSWTQLTNGLPTGNQGRVGITMFTPNPDTLYALYVGTDSQLGGIYRSFDGGSSWVEIQTVNTGVSSNAMGGFGWYFSGVYVNPYDYTDVFFDGVQLWRTENSGGNWNQADPPWYTYEVHADKHDMVFLGPESFLIGTDGGLYLTTNDGDDWDKIENNKTNEFYRVEHTEFNPSQYFGGMQDNGTTGGNASMSTWPRIYGGDGFQMRFHPTNEELIFAEWQNGNIVFTENGGTNWTNLFFPDADERTNWDTPYLLSHHTWHIMYAASHKVYEDQYSPNSLWQAISPDLTDGNIFGSSFHTISGIDESPLSSKRLYACTTDGNVWTTTNRGSTWDSVHMTLPNRYVTSVKASPTDSNTVYVTHSGYKYNDFFAHVHKSINNGNTWMDISGDLPPIAVNDIIVYPGYSDSVLFIGTDAGVYGTLDGGNDWERIGSNMPIISVLDLELDTVNNRLIAATVGKSIMTYPLDSLVTPVDDTTIVQTLTIVTSSTPRTCFETFNGTATATVVGGTPPYTYAWVNGMTGQTITGVPAGLYNVTVTDVNNDQGTAVAEVFWNSIHPQPIVGPLNGSLSVQSWNNFNYDVPATTGSTFDWSVSGGVLNSATTNSASIHWHAGPFGKIRISETDINGCISLDSFYIDIQFVGINEQEPIEASIFPNPSTGVFTVDFGQKVSTEMSVINASGTLVQKTTVEESSKASFDINVPAGLYFIQYSLNGNDYKKKMIVE